MKNLIVYLENLKFYLETTVGTGLRKAQLSYKADILIK